MTRASAEHPKVPPRLVDSGLTGGLGTSWGSFRASAERHHGVCAQGLLLRSSVSLQNQGEENRGGHPASTSPEGAPAVGGDGFSS